MPLINIAHRGARSLAPENTLLAARKAFFAGADLWETDIAVTADGELILMHDDSLARTTNVRQRFPERAPWIFTTFTLAEIRQLDAGSWFIDEDPFGQIAAGAISAAELAAMRGELVPTLREALALTKALGWRINLELKRQPPPQDKFPLVEAVLALIDEVGIAPSQVCLSSFNHEWLRQCARLHPDIEVQALVGYHEDDVLDWSHPEFTTYNVRYTLITPEEVRRLEAAGIHINLFTANEGADWERFAAAHVSGIFTDFPQKLQNYLHKPLSQDKIMHDDLELKLCIINGYPKSSREKFDRDHVSQAHENYVRFLKTYVPKAQCDIFYIADLDNPLPAGNDLLAYDGYIWTGSDLTIYHDDDPRVTRQIELSRAIYEAGVPQYGSCWGIQMAAVAAGGEVKKNPKGREWGITGTIRRTEAGKSSLLLKGKPDAYHGFIMHLDEVTRLPEGATLLATGDHTHVQALAVRHGKGEFWATQYHPEYNLYEMAQLIDARSGPLVKEGFFASEEDVHAHAAKLRALYEHPNDQDLRAELGIGDDVLDPEILQQELRNWVDYLVVPSLRR